MQNDRNSSSAGGLFAGLMRGVGDLVRSEINLATTEMTGKAFRVGKDAGFLAGGGAVAFAGSLAIMAAIIRMLETFLPRWLSAFVVGALMVGAGASLAKRGLSALKETDLAPERTIETLKHLTH